MRLIALTLALAMAIAPMTPAIACCMVPRSYEGTISQTAQEAVIFHGNGREELILRINYAIKGETMPDHFAWVVTVPNEPDAYSIADDKLFRDVFAWSERMLRAPTRDRDGGTLGGPIKKGIQLSPEVRVGPYRIQPVRAVGAQALEALNEWLAENGFPKEDPEHMKYFVDQGFTFLCVRFDPKKGESAVAKSSPVPPLHLSFASKTPYYPLRFSSRQGVFDVNLTMLTKTALDYDKSSASLKKINWSKDRRYTTNRSVSVSDFPKTLAAVHAKSRFKGDTDAWFLNRLSTTRVNDGETIATWKKDLFFHTL